MGAAIAHLRKLQPTLEKATTGDDESCDRPLCNPRKLQPMMKKVPAGDEKRFNQDDISYG